MPSTYHLKQGDVLLGVLKQDGGDFPWFHAAFEPTEAFAELKPLFDRKNDLADAGDWGEWENIYQQLTDMKVHLFDLDKDERIDEFLLDIVDETASFRY